MQTGQRPNNRQTRAQHHLADTGEGVVVGGFAVQSPFAALLVAADHEYRVVGPCRDGQRRQQVDGEGRQPHDAGFAQQRYHASAGGQSDEQDHHRQQHGADGPIDEHQHDRDDDDGDDRHLGQARVTDNDRVVGQGSLTRDVGLHPRRRLRVRDDLANRVNRLVADGSALVTAQVDLDVGGLVVVALDTRGRESLPPEIQRMLDVFGCPAGAS